MDGQFHTVEFDPSSTADEVLRLVIQRIGLREGAQVGVFNNAVFFIMAFFILTFSICRFYYGVFTLYFLSYRFIQCRFFMILFI